MNRKRKIIVEDCYNVVFEGITTPIPKAYVQTLRQPKIKPCQPATSNQQQ